MDHGYDAITITTGSGASSVTGNVSGNLGSIYDFGQYNNTNYTWSTSTDTITLTDYSNTSPWSNSLDVKGDANFEGDVKIKGKSLVESLEKIEEKLAILRPNEALEEKWENLRNLRKAYMELEAEIIEKEKIWDILKK